MSAILPYPRPSADLPDRLVSEIVGEPLDGLTEHERALVLAAAERAARQAFSVVLERRGEAEAEERRTPMPPASAFPPPKPLPPMTRWMQRRRTAEFVLAVGGGCAVWVALIAAGIAWVCS